METDRGKREALGETGGRAVLHLGLFFSFLRLGLTAFGGPAMVAYIRRLAVEQKGWLSKESFGEGVALCQSIPGATAMQVAAYVGARAGGTSGALASYAVSAFRPSASW